MGICIDDHGALSTYRPTAADPAGCRIQSQHSDIHSGGFRGLIPVTLIYNTYGFSVFSGKVRVTRE
jgi:hypothetical protein